MAIATVQLIPNADKVAAEIIQDEVIIINVATGTYYNTEGIGAWVWERCAAGDSLAAIVLAGGARFRVGAEQLEADLASFAASLVAEELVTEKTAVFDAATAAKEALAEGLAYKAPILVVYRDLKDLLALDPPMPRLDLAPAHSAE